MTTAASRQADNVAYPGDSYVRVTTTSSVPHFAPTAWHNKYVDITAITGDVYIRFGTDGTVSVDNTTESVRTGTTALAAATSGPHLIIPAGQTRAVRWLSTHTHWAVKASAAGFVFIVLSTGTD